MKESTKGYVAGKRAELEAKQLNDRAERDEHERQITMIDARMATRADLIKDLKADVPEPAKVAQPI